MGKFIDLTGQTFGRLQALERVQNRGTSTMWLCLCLCGKQTVVAAGDLRNWHITSCGCSRKTADGLSHTREYKSWSSMIDRCRNNKRDDFHIYGGRGIYVYQPWVESFDAFMSHVGKRPIATTLDRIDVNGNYVPGNVRWASARTQSRNRRSNIFDELDVAAIRALARDGVRQTKIAEMFLTSDPQICKIIQRRIWADVEPAW
jgi:hypothetical protein